MADKHPPSVQQALKDAEKHGTREALKTGVPFEGSKIEGVKVTKKDFSHGEIHDTRSNKEPNT